MCYTPETGSHQTTKEEDEPLHLRERKEKEREVVYHRTVSPISVPMILFGRDPESKLVKISPWRPRRVQNMKQTSLVGSLEKEGFRKRDMGRS